MLQNSVSARENYLYFADSNYLAARLLILNKFYIPGISIAEQAVEQYLKLKIYELIDKGHIKELDVENCHNVIKLFEIVEPGMEANKLSLKKLGFYQSLLETLRGAYKLRYFDAKGVLGELNKGKGVNLTFTFEDLDKFDEICCELRNAVFIKGQGGCPVNRAYKDRVFFKRDTTKAEAMYRRNKQYNRFKVGEVTLANLYSH